MIDNRFSSAATGRPSSLQENFCTAFLPTKVDTCNCEQYYTETLDNSRYIMLNVNGLRESSLLSSNNLSVTSPSTASGATSPQLGRRPHLNCFAYLIRATSLLGKVTSFVNLKGKDHQEVLPPSHPDSEFADLDREIEAWYDQLPMHLRNTPANFEFYKDAKYPADNRQFILVITK
jgi:hypothetical protein